MKISKFSCKLQELFFKQREKYRIETLARSFSGVKWSCGLSATCCPPFLCKAAALWGVCRMSSATVAHQVLTLFFHCSHMFPVWWPILPALLGALSVHITYLRIQNANHKHSCTLTSPRCSSLTDHRAGNLHSLQACWHLSWKFGRRPGCVVNFPCRAFPQLLSWCCRARLCWHSKKKINIFNY